MQRSAERDVERNASPHLFTPHSDLPSFASDAPPTADIGHGNGWILLSDSTNQSVPPMRGTDGIKGTVPSFPSITQSRNDVDSCVNTVRSLAKTRPSPLVVETEVTISRGAIGGHSTLAPPSGKIQPIRVFLPACRRRSPSRSYKRAAAVPLP